MRTILTVSLALLLPVSSHAAGRAGAAPRDKLKIISVDSAQPVVRGVENEFTIEVEYKLDSADEGEINMGFNLDRPNAFKMVDSFLVQKGQGVATLKAKVIPVDWGRRAGFTVMVNLSKLPHETRWRTLAGDKQEIAVGQ